jgi:hypothetical protein
VNTSGDISSVCQARLEIVATKFTWRGLKLRFACPHCEPKHQPICRKLI